VEWLKITITSNAIAKRRSHSQRAGSGKAVAIVQDGQDNFGSTDVLIEKDLKI
jgi:hypothetical protein